MYKTHNTFVDPEVKMVDLIYENNAYLLFLENFGVDFSVENKTIAEICSENSLNINAFIAIANVYNGFFPDKNDKLPYESIESVLLFLKNTHKFYLKDKYPQLKICIKTLKEKSKSNDVELIERFFNDYFKEVTDHLDYEEKVAFPYFYNLINNNSTSDIDFTVKKYIIHHTDIETKVEDLKNLILKHLKINVNLNIKRNFLNSLFELESDLKIHSIIEENILIPLIEDIEVQKYG